MKTYQTMTKIELQNSLLMTEHHLRWLMGTKGVMQFRANMGYEPLDAATQKWYDDNITSTQNQIKHLNSLIAAK